MSPAAGNEIYFSGETVVSVGPQANFPSMAAVVCWAGHGQHQSFVATGTLSVYSRGF